MAMQWLHECAPAAAKCIVMAAWLLHGTWFGEEAAARNLAFFRVNWLQLAMKGTSCVILQLRVVNRIGVAASRLTHRSGRGGSSSSPASKPLSL